MNKPVKHTLTAMRLSFLLAVVLAVSASLANADAIAISSGNMVVTARTNNIFLRATATGSWCVNSQADGIRNQIYSATPGGLPPKSCQSVFFIKDEARSAQSVFFNYYNRRVFFGAGPPAPIAKFPAPVDESATSDSAAVGSSTRAFSGFKSSEGFPFKSAKLTAHASVNISKVNASGLATAETFDPWFFTPEEDTVLTLEVSLNDVTMNAQADSPLFSATTLEAFGSFGIGDVTGMSVLASWDFFKEVDNNSSFSSSEAIPVFRMELQLTAGVTYWMLDEIETAATSAPRK
jgi:hypothetical protein